MTCVACDGDGEPCPYCQGEDAGCVHCGGKGQACDLCGGEGTLDVPHCPYDELDGALCQASALAAHTIDGAGWPAEGGMGAQTQWYLDFVGYIKAERARCESELVGEK